MLNIECYTCGRMSTIEFEDSDYATVFMVLCPNCGAEINLPENEFFYDLNIDDDERILEDEYKKDPLLTLFE